MTGLVAEELRKYLDQSRDRLIAALDGLSDHEIRRPLTPTGTNLLGLIKHCAGCEWEYLGNCVGRTPDFSLPWTLDEAWDGVDMYALAHESGADILELYARVRAHSDETLRTLPLDSPAHVRWWREGTRDTTFAELAVRTLTDAAQHAGQADILREQLRPDSARDTDYGDAAWWDAWVQRVQAAADEATGL